MILAAPDPFLLLVAVCAFFLGGIIKGAMGFGLPILAIPAMTAAHSLPMALSIAVFPVFATNIWQFWSYRRYWQGDFLPGFLVSGAVGLIVGSILLGQVREAYLEIALGSLVLLYLIRSSRKRPQFDAPAPVRPTKIAPLVGLGAGAVHGATGLSGLVGTPYFHALGLQRPEFILCNGAMFSLFSIMHAPTLTGLGLYEPAAITVGLAALPIAFVGLWLGGVIGKRLNADWFSKLVIGILSVTAIIPIWNGLRDVLLG